MRCRACELQRARHGTLLRFLDEQKVRWPKIVNGLRDCSPRIFSDVAASLTALRRYLESDASRKSASLRLLRGTRKVSRRL